METHYPPILRQYVGEERIGRVANFDSTTIDAAHICARCQSTSVEAEGAEPLNRKERHRYNQQVRPVEELALIAWAKENNLWEDEKEFIKQYAERKIGEGAEQKVFLKEDGKMVVKVNAGNYHGAWLEYFNRLLFHTVLFPATAYAMKGLMIFEGSLSVIVEQPFVLLNEGASRPIIETYLNHHGFERIKNDDYYNSSMGVYLEDLHDENIFLDEKRNILFIDPVIYFETMDLLKAGKNVYHFPF
jgi:hypothetical protein